MPQPHSPTTAYDAVPPNGSGFNPRAQPEESRAVNRFSRHIPLFTPESFPFRHLLLSKLYFRPSSPPPSGTLWQRCWSWLPRPFFPWLANQCAQTKTQNPHEQSSGSSLLNPLAPLLLIVTAPQVRLVSRRLSAAAKHRAALLQRHEDSAHSGKVGHCDAMLLL
jgi:hypothetical protein